MDPHRFLRIVVGDLALRSPATLQHPPTTTFFCTIKLANFSSQKVITTIPLLPSGPSSSTHPTADLRPISACFTLDQPAIDKAASAAGTPLRLTISIYKCTSLSTRCLPTRSTILGTISLPLDITPSLSRKEFTFHNGWLSPSSSSSSSSSSAQLLVKVWSEQDPRFVFQFGDMPECSPQVLQVHGSIKQPVFTCKFGFRNSHLERSSSSSWWGRSASWFASLAKERETQPKERKGWSVTVHDLSGSPVSAASMVTPFVPSPGCDRVSKTNPGAWLILRPDQGAWQPWGRLEAWLECSDAVGYRFELLPDCGVSAGITLCESVINRRKGGRFTIDMTSGVSPAVSPGSSFDLSAASSSSESGSWGHAAFPRGFVMSATVEGSRRGRDSNNPLEVVISAEQVTCREDAAVFLALGAAMDLSMDACRLFSERLRKGLRPEVESPLG